MLRDRRIAIVHAVLVVFAGAIVLRAAEVQIWQGDVWRARAEGQQLGEASIPAPRGPVLDASGTPLAESRERVQLAIVPREVADRTRLLRELARAGVSAPVRARATDRSRKWVQLPGSFPRTDVAALIGMAGVHPTAVGQRVYAVAGGVQTIVGHANADGEGLDGIELALDSVLRGERGRTAYVKDSRGGRFLTPDAIGSDPRPGHTVTLTINGTLQAISDQALGDAVSRMGADGGDIIVLDPNSGEVLAMASRRPGAGATSATAIVEPYQPGSTLKPFTAAAVLARGKARVTDVVETYNGRYTLFGWTFRDVHAASRLSLADVIRFSSNIGISQFAARLTPREQYEALRDFGFGTPTGIAYPGESSGRLREPRYWSKLSSASIAMGYEISVTPLQLVLAYGAIANGGELLEPALVKEVRSPDGTVVFTNRRRVVRRVLTPELAAELRRLLTGVVDSGTATDAELATFAVGGKSGTVRGMRGGRYVQGSYTASFVGLFPADRPQYVILVKLDNPKGSIYGGKAAAPVSKVVLEAAIAARDAALDRDALTRRRTEPVFASRDGASGQGAGSRGGRTITIAAGAVDEVGRDSVSDGGENVSVPFIVNLTDRPRKMAPSVRVHRIPDVRGLPLRAAVYRLHQSGFTVRLAAGAAGTTDPAAGTPLRTGSVVRLYQRR